MIRSWQHKGLKRFYYTGNHSDINSKHVRRIKAILELLDASTHPGDLNLPGMDFHGLKGQQRDFIRFLSEQIGK